MAGIAACAHSRHAVEYTSMAVPVRVILLALASVSVCACDSLGIVPEADGRIDPVADTTACLPLTASGMCNVVEQCGCGSYQRCVLILVEPSCTFVERCMEVPYGALNPGDPCETSEECRPGTHCWRHDGEPLRCWDMCVLDSDCLMPGARCVVPVTLEVDDRYSACHGERLAPPYKHCSMD